jgi:P27 family predicted phage terminase small subunit
MTARDPHSRRAPSHLSPASRRWFESITDEWDLEPHGLRLLEAAASTWDRWNSARVLIDAEGITTVDRYGAAKAHPAIAIERDSRLAFARLVRELGLSEEAPESRPLRIAR